MARILILDDDREFLAMISDMLRHLGHEPVAALDPAEFGVRLGEGRPDLIFMDVMMPGGAAAAEKALAALPGGLLIPLVLVTALPEAMALRVFTSHPKRSYLGKPLRVEDLAEAIARALAG